MRSKFLRSSTLPRWIALLASIGTACHSGPSMKRESTSSQETIKTVTFTRRSVWDNQSPNSCDDLFARLVKNSQNPKFCEKFSSEKECQRFKEFLAAKAPTVDQETWVALIPWWLNEIPPGFVSKERPMLILGLKKTSSGMIEYMDRIVAGFTSDEEAASFVSSFYGQKTPTDDGKSLFDYIKVESLRQHPAARMQENALCAIPTDMPVLVRQIGDRLSVLVFGLEKTAVLTSGVFIPLSKMGVAVSSSAPTSSVGPATPSHSLESFQK